MVVCLFVSRARRPSHTPSNQIQDKGKGKKGGKRGPRPKSHSGASGRLRWKVVWKKGHAPTTAELAAAGTRGIGFFGRVFAAAPYSVLMEHPTEDC